LRPLLRRLCHVARLSKEPTPPAITIMPQNRISFNEFSAIFFSAHQSALGSHLLIKRRRTTPWWLPGG
jgi:hypothetical protein